MKKQVFLLLLIALSGANLLAQESDMYSLLYHVSSEYTISPNNFMQQRDGNFIVNATYFGTDELESYIGRCVYKISPSPLAIIDSLFIPDTSMVSYEMWEYYALDPDDEGNVMAKYEYHEDCDSTFLRVSHFPDDDLQVNPEEDLVVPLCEGLAYGGVYLIDQLGDMLMSYYKVRDIASTWPRFDAYGYRMGMDGTPKCHVMFAEDIPEWEMSYQFREYKVSPPKYFRWRDFIGDYHHYGSRNYSVFVADSVFHSNSMILSGVLRAELLYPPYEYYPILYERLYSVCPEIIPIDGDDILMASEYVMDTNCNYNGEFGIAVVKYDLRTMRMKDYVVFNDYPGQYNDAKVMGFKQMPDGSVYLVYKENGYPEESVIVVKMGTNLQVDWKRFIKTGDVIIAPPLMYPIIYKDVQDEEKGIAWVAQGQRTTDEYYGMATFILNHDGIPASVGGGIEVRPYMFYPNPAQDQLHLQYSPDVQPKHVELYDLQGRLVRSQGNTFETVDLGQLPAGTYTLRVTMQDGQTFSDKVVKE